MHFRLAATSTVAAERSNFTGGANESVPVNASLHFTGRGSRDGPSSVVNCHPLWQAESKVQ
jgi:hypothetical protein